MSSESALILKLSPLPMTVLGSVPYATPSEPRTNDQCVTVPTALVSIAELDVNRDADVPVGRSGDVRCRDGLAGLVCPAALVRSTVGNARVGRRGSVQPAGQIRPPNTIRQFVQLSRE